MASYENVASNNAAPKCGFRHKRGGACCAGAARAGGAGAGAALVLLVLVLVPVLLLE